MKRFTQVFAQRRPTRYGLGSAFTYVLLVVGASLVVFTFTAPATSLVARLATLVGGLLVLLASWFAATAKPKRDD